MKISRNTLPKNGFTLAEILVSMTITVIILGVLVFITQSAFQTLSNGTNRTTSSQKTQQVIEILETDLQSMIFQKGNEFDWLSATGSNTDDDSDDFDNSSESNNATGFYSRLTFFTQALDRYDGDVINPDNLGNIACVDYGIAYVDPLDTVEGEFPTFVLYRNIVNPDETFEKILGQDDLALSVNDADTPLQDAVNVLCTNIRELSVTLHIEYEDLASNETEIAKLPIISVGGSNDFRVQEFILRGDEMEIDGDASIGDFNSIGLGRIVAIDINVQMLNDDVVPLIGLPPSDSIRRRIEEGTSRFSKTIFIPHLNG